jgi:hypothetical protein
MDLTTRSEIIASYAYGKRSLADAPVPPAPVAKPVPAAPDAQPAGDDAVTSKIAAAKTAVAEAIQAQNADPDAKTDPADATVMAGLQTAADALEKADKDQQVDVAGAKAAAPPPAEPAKPAAAPAQTAAGAVPFPPKKTQPPVAKGKAPAGEPVPAQGDQDPDVECADPNCAHPASVHQNTGEGANTGACTTPGCDCAGLTVTANAEQETPGEVEDPEAAGVKLAGDMPAPMPVMPIMPAEPSGATTESNPPPTIPGSDNIGPAFSIVVGVIEGQPTGDGREIAPNALTWRPPPMPLMLLKTSTHDPSGMDMNDPAVIAGRIDTLERTPGENGTQIISAKGYFLLDEDGTYAASLVEQMGRVGISADIAAQDEEISGVEIDESGMPTEITQTLLEGVIMGFTMLPFPAFAACYIVLGDGATAEPIPMEAETASAGQTVHWMTFEECASCDTEGTDVLVAAGGPVRPPAEWFENPRFEEGDGRLQEIYAKRGQTQFACPLTVTADGRVFGHIAPWGVCHIGFGGKCITPPRSQTDYAHFKRGEVLTANGEFVRAGVITADTGHAGLSLGASGAMSHYDDTGTVTAFVNAGEDEYGIWVAGSIDPDATESQVTRLRACGVSGDWRNRELVAALSVPTPGYPLARVRGRQEALVASGAKVMWAIEHPEVPDAEANVDEALRASLAPLVQESGRLARRRIFDAAADRARKRIAAGR